MRINVDEILRSHGLKSTRQRKEVLTALSKIDSALSQPDLEKKLKGKVDRVTLYRILSSFQERGIVHSILDQYGITNYATCSPSCSEGKHKDEHVHFNCSNCHRVFCLEIKTPKVKIPVEYSAENVTVIATGLCKKCKAH
jgi:Fur family ferric uptake transcriptional regulator